MFLQINQFLYGENKTIIIQILQSFDSIEFKPQGRHKTQTRKKTQKDKKTNSPKTKIKNTDLYKLTLNRIMNTRE